MKWESALSGAVIVGVALVTLVLVFAKKPESVTVGSADGKVIVSGLVRGSEGFTVQEKESEHALPLLGAAYEVSAKGGFDKNVRISFSVPEKADDYAVYTLNQTLGAWTEEYAVTEYTDTHIAIVTDVLGVFALGKKQSIQAPSFLTAYDDMVKLAPKNAVGYQTFVSYKTPNGEKVFLQDEQDTGSCGGEVLLPSNGVSASEKTRTVNVLVNDVATLVTFYFTTTWMTTPEGTGCPEERPLKRNSSYGILSP